MSKSPYVIRMSRGIGKAQREILEALASNDPNHCWRRVELQQAVWGAQPGSRPDRIKRYERDSRPRKNVAWGKGRYESNFTRALSTLIERGLVDADKRESGHMVKIRITPAGYRLITGMGMEVD